MRTTAGGPRRRAAQMSAVGLTAGVLVGALCFTGPVAAAANPPVDRSMVAAAVDRYAFSVPTAMAASCSTMLRLWQEQQEWQERHIKICPHPGPLPLMREREIR